MKRTATVHFSVAIPGMLSWLVHFDAAAPVAGLNDLEADWDRPPVWLTFQSYHLMVAIGMLFIVSTLYASYLRWRGTLFTKRWLLWYFVFAVLLAHRRQRSRLGHGRGRPATVDRVSRR